MLVQEVQQLQQHMSQRERAGDQIEQQILALQKQLREAHFEATMQAATREKVERELTEVGTP